jgi:hypothetical protein
VVGQREVIGEAAIEVLVALVLALVLALVVEAL